jgi:hypothetical protein
MKQFYNALDYVYRPDCRSQLLNEPQDGQDFGLRSTHMQLPEPPSHISGMSFRLSALLFNYLINNTQNKFYLRHRSVVITVVSSIYMYKVNKKI